MTRQSVKYTINLCKPHVSTIDDERLSVKEFLYKIY